MITLHDILYKCPVKELKGDVSAEVVDFFFDSREVVPGSLFVAVKGSQTDGHAFIGKAVDQGAVAIVCEAIPTDAAAHVNWILVENAGYCLGLIAANYYGNPADQLQIVGVTGTNGKTTTATLLYQLFNELGERSGLLSTVAVKIGEATLPATHTTPDAKQIHAYFRKMVDAGCRFCFMEVSSHALDQHRVAGIRFEGAVFTNITHDHLDYHLTFPAYIKAKKMLFDGLGSRAFALVNADDKHGDVMLQNCKARKRKFAVERMADYKARIIENSFEGLLLEINGQQAWFRLVGSFNASNLLAVFATAVELGMNTEDVLLELSKIEGVSGRFQAVRDQERGITAIVDYAHTPDALKNVLETIRDIRSGDARIITVVGCGGNRDRTKRPVMAEIATKLSDQVVLTSDNPRNEDPAEIIAEMIAGVPVTGKRKVMSIQDRREAISVACRLAQPKDIILVAGKGHENYQEIKGVKHPFDDRLVLLETFKMLAS